MGQVVGAWTTLCNVWADIRLPSGLEQLRGDAFVSRTRASIRIRKRDDITPAMRVVHGATVYEIKAVLTDMQGRAFVDLVCEAVA
jgi:SPP1 family predicted phage head-tail adaptor